MVIRNMKEIFRGIKWIGLLRGLTRLIAFFKIAVIARILTPEQFGLFGIASLVLAFLEIATEMGVNVFLIQSRGDIEEHIDTAYVVSIIRGAIITLLMVIIAPLVSSFFSVPESRNILLLMSVIPLLRGFINPAIVKFQKYLEFKKEFYFRLFIYSFDALVAIVIAVMFKSPTSLVWGMLAGVIVEIVLSWIFIKPRPHLVFNIIQTKNMVKRGKWVTIYVFLNYLFLQGDDVVVGKILGASSLGIYQIAYRLSSLPIYETGEIFGKVTFPIYAKYSGEKRKLVDQLIKVTLVISALVVPVGMLMYMYAESIVLVLFGSQWTAAIPVVKVLAIFSVIRSISGSTTAFFLGVGKQEYVSVIMAASTLVMGLSIIPLTLKYGLIGAGLSAIGGSLFAIPIILYYLYRVIK